MTKDAIKVNYSTVQKALSVQEGQGPRSNLEKCPDVAGKPTATTTSGI